MRDSVLFFFFSSRRRHTRCSRDWNSDVCSSDLAELRYRIRKFLREGDTVASETGLEPQQYLLLLMIRGIPNRQEATVSNLAERLVLKHHSVVEDRKSVV